KHDLVRIDFPNYQKDFSISWEDLAKTIYDNPSFGKELNQKSYFEDELNQVLTPGMSRDEKINTILNFVKNKVVDRKSTRLNSSHVKISYAVFCLKKKMNYVLSDKS